MQRAPPARPPPPAHDILIPETPSTLNLLGDILAEAADDTPAAHDGTRAGSALGQGRGIAGIISEGSPLPNDVDASGRASGAGPALVQAALPGSTPLKGSADTSDHGVHEGAQLGEHHESDTPFDLDDVGMPATLRAALSGGSGSRSSGGGGGGDTGGADAAASPSRPALEGTHASVEGAAATSLTHAQSIRVAAPVVKPGLHDGDHDGAASEQKLAPAATAAPARTGEGQHRPVGSYGLGDPIPSDSDSEDSAPAVPSPAADSTVQKASKARNAGASPWSTLRSKAAVLSKIFTLGKSKRVDPDHLPEQAYGNISFEESFDAVRRAVVRDGTDGEGEMSYADMMAKQLFEVNSHVATRLIIMPSAQWKKAWDIMIILLVLYNSILLPIDLGFKAYISANEVRNVADVVIDILFAIDILLTFRTATVAETGLPILSPSDIAKSYAGGWLTIDVFATLPWEVLTSLLGLGGGATELSYVQALKCLRLLRLGRIVRFLENFRFANAWRLIRLMAFFMACMHLVGCVWHFVATTIEDETTDPNVWTNVAGLADAGLKKRYWTSVYQALLMLVGENVEPATDTETSFAIVFMLYGAILSATLFGQVAVLLQNTDSTNRLYQSTMDSVNQNMRNLNLPSDLQLRIRNFYEYSYFRHRLLDHESFFSQLSEPLHSEVSLFLHRQVVQQVPLFHQCPADFLVAVVRALRPRVFMPGDFIVRAGETGESMFFITSGRVNVFAKNGTTLLAVLESGAYFGELALLSLERRTATVQASTYCDMKVLRSDDLQGLLGSRPELDRAMKKVAHEQVGEYRRRLVTAKAGARRHSVTVAGIVRRASVDAAAVGVAAKHLAAGGRMPGVATSGDGASDDRKTGFGENGGAGVTQPVRTGPLRVKVFGAPPSLSSTGETVGSGAGADTGAADGAKITFALPAAEADLVRLTESIHAPQGPASVSRTEARLGRDSGVMYGSGRVEHGLSTRVMVRRSPTGQVVVNQHIVRDRRQSQAAAHEIPLGLLGTGSAAAATRASGRVAPSSALSDDAPPRVPSDGREVVDDDAEMDDALPLGASARTADASVASGLQDDWEGMQAFDSWRTRADHGGSFDAEMDLSSRSADDVAGAATAEVAAGVVRGTGEGRGGSAESPSTSPLHGAVDPTSRDHGARASAAGTDADIVLAVRQAVTREVATAMDTLHERIASMNATMDRRIGALETMLTAALERRGTP